MTTLSATPALSMEAKYALIDNATTPTKLSMEEKYPQPEPRADGKSVLGVINDSKVYLESALVLPPDDTPELFAIEELTPSCGMPLLDLAPKNLERNCLTDASALVRTVLLYIKQLAAISYSVYKVLHYNNRCNGSYPLERFVSTERAFVQKVRVQHRGYRRPRNSRHAKLARRANDLNSCRRTNLIAATPDCSTDGQLVDPLFVAASPGTRRRSAPSSRVPYGDLKQYEPPNWFTVYFRTLDELHKDETARLVAAKYDFPKSLDCTGTMPFKEFTPVSEDVYHSLIHLYHQAVYCRWNLLQGLDDMELLPEEQLNGTEQDSPFRRFVSTIDKTRVICFEFRMRLMISNVAGNMANQVRAAYMNVDIIAASKTWVENLTPANEQRLALWADANGLTADDSKVIRVYPPVQILAYALLEQLSGTTPSVVCTEISAEAGVAETDGLRDLLVLSITIRAPLHKRKSRDDHSWFVYLAMDSAVIGINLSCRLTMMVSYDNVGLITLGTIRVNKYKAMRCAPCVVGYILGRNYSPESFNATVAKQLEMVYARDQESAFALEFGAYMDIVEKVSDNKWVDEQRMKHGAPQTSTSSAPTSAAAATSSLKLRTGPVPIHARRWDNHNSASHAQSSKLHEFSNESDNGNKRKADCDAESDDDAEDLPA